MGARVRSGFTFAPFISMLQRMLGDQWRLRDRAVRNRTVLAAMTNKQSHDDGTVSDEEIRWLEMRARGGFGIVTTCAANVLRSGRGWDGELGVYADAHIPGLTRLADRLHAAGALALCQIFHGGYRSPSRLIGGRPVSADNVSLDVPDFEPARAMSREEVYECIDAFAEAARRCEQAGFDGVEIHGAHTYLITQFLSRELNHRDDEFGGTLENRYRFLSHVVRRCRERTGNAFIVGVRLSPGVPLPHAGMSFEETRKILPRLEADGVDFVHLSLRDAAGAEAPKAGFPSGAEAIASTRAALSDSVRVIACGGVVSKAQADAVLSHGADGVAVARIAIGHADWPRLLAEGVDPAVPPYTRAHLAGQGLSAPFLDYMARWPGFVSEAG